MHSWCNSVAKICTWTCNIRKDANQVSKKVWALVVTVVYVSSSIVYCRLQRLDVIAYCLRHHRGHTECESDAFIINSASRHDATLHNTRPHLRNKTRAPCVCDDRACSLNAIWHPTGQNRDICFLKISLSESWFAGFWNCAHRLWLMYSWCSSVAWICTWIYIMCRVANQVFWIRLAE